MDELQLDGLKIDSLVDLLRASYFLEEWDRMLEIADELLLSANHVYDKQKEALQSGQCYSYGNRKRHLIYYFGFSQMAKGNAFEKKGLYEDSLACIKTYADLSWLDDGSKEAKEEIDLFKLFAKGNSYSVKLLAGKLEVLDSYVQFLKESRPEELFPGLITILESALKHNFNVDEVLQSLSGDTLEVIHYYDREKRKTRYLTNYYYTLALYRFKMGQHENAIHNTLQGLVASDNFKDVASFKKCVALFEVYRDYASDEQKESYNTYMLAILKEELKNEKNYYIYDDRLGTV
ncbi:hypothetical protein ACE41H_02230 [Paenibacillus enshidis]|uniref:DNA-binding protein n=1 Tax=Paenibacillus enshidis TaxID=1458439 RepID=A0ABV5AN80_9BACL